MRRSSTRRFANPLLIGLLIGVVAGCGSDNATSTTPTTASPATTNASAATTAAGTGSTAAATPGTGSTATDSFPVTVAHKYGSITVDAAPQRVVSIGFSDQDYLLALGVTPIAVRDWYGDQPEATWPWAQDELGDAKPTVLPSGDLNFEQIAGLKPDLIVGVSSGMTDTDYATLSKIAPTLAQPKEYIDYGTPWDAATEIIGKAVGRSAAAAAEVQHINDLYAAVRAAHPEFAGKTASVDFYFNDQPGAYASEDNRARIINSLGFTTPPKFDELAGDAFYFSVSNEDISLLDTDVVIWIVASDDGMKPIADIPTRPSMRAFQEGREIATNAELSGAFSFGSPLSIEYVLDELVPELALAVDGDPATLVPSAAAIGSGGAAAVPVATTVAPSSSTP